MIPSFPGSDAYRSAGSEYRENTRNRVLWYLRRKKLKKFSLFLMALYSPPSPSSPVYIVQGSTSPFAARFAAFVMPGLYNRCLCHVLNLTELSVSIGAPDAMFPGCSLYKSFAVSVQSDLPFRIPKVSAKVVFMTHLTHCTSTLYACLFRDLFHIFAAEMRHENSKKQRICLK